MASPNPAARVEPPRQEAAQSQASWSLLSESGRVIYDCILLPMNYGIVIGNALPRHLLLALIRPFSPVVGISAGRFLYLAAPSLIERFLASGRQAISSTITHYRTPSSSYTFSPAP